MGSEFIRKSLILQSSNCVKIFINILGDRVDPGIQIIFNLEKTELVIFSDKVNS